MKNLKIVVSVGCISERSLKLSNGCLGDVIKKVFVVDVLTGIKNIFVSFAINVVHSSLTFALPSSVKTGDFL